MTSTRSTRQSDTRWISGSFRGAGPLLATCLTFSAVLTVESLSEEAAVEQGRAFVQTHCATCHAIGMEGESPLAIAPPFRTLHERYPVEQLAEAFVEGFATGHPTMPQFQLDPYDVENLISYMESLERP